MSKSKVEKNPKIYSVRRALSEKRNMVSSLLHESTRQSKASDYTKPEQVNSQTIKKNFKMKRLCEKCACMVSSYFGNTSSGSLSPDTHTTLLTLQALPGLAPNHKMVGLTLFSFVHYKRERKGASVNITTV